MRGTFQCAKAVIPVMIENKRVASSTWRIGHEVATHFAEAKRHTARCAAQAAKVLRNQNGRRAYGQAAIPGQPRWRRPAVYGWGSMGPRNDAYSSR